MAVIKVNISCNCDPDSQCADVFRSISTICEYDSGSDIIVKFTFDRMELLIKNARLEECEDAARLLEHARKALEKEGRTLLVHSEEHPRIYHSALRAWQYNCAFQPPFAGELCSSTSAYSSDSTKGAKSCETLLKSLELDGPSKQEVLNGVVALHHR